MTDKPSDRAIAQAFFKACDTVNLDKKALVGLLNTIELEAHAIDAAAPDGAQELVGEIVGEFRDVGGYTPSIQWAGGEHPGIGTKLYTVPPSQDAEDAARLDWMVHHGAALRNETTLRQELRGWYVLLPGRLNHFKRYPTARAAIDAARTTDFPPHDGETHDPAANST